MRLLNHKTLFFSLVLSFFCLTGKAVYSQTEQKVEAPLEYQQGVELMEKGEFEQALPLLEASIDKDPSFPPAYYAKAVCLARKEKPEPEQARMFHAKAVELGFQYNEWLGEYINRLKEKE